jgi:hypothetical protein
VHFIRHLPKITPAELAHMEELNPKSPHELREEEEIREFLEGKAPKPPARTPPGHRHPGGKND